MSKGWNKGFTKETHPSVMKISRTMKSKKLDNFKRWRDKMKKSGKIKSKYPPLKKNGDLAELIGVILGDGHICKFPRCDSLIIFSNANNKGFVKRYAMLVEKIFDKKPTISKQSNSNCIRISIYEKFISKRLGIPTGARKDIKVKIPDWIYKNKKFSIRYLRGLYEAEGSFSIHKPTSTYKLSFSNVNISMLNNVFKLLKRFGFYSNLSGHRVQVSRKEEVFKLKKMLEFREY